MNKAFVREPEPTRDHCPRCGSLGQPVGPQTLEAHLTPDVRRGISETACFCPYSACEVVYFDGFERTVAVSALASPVYPKDPDAPICACFGLTCDDIEADVREGGVSRTRACIERAQSADTRCVTSAINGRSCVPEVQRYYLKSRGSAQRGEPS